MKNIRQKCLLYFISKMKTCSKLKLAKIFFLIKQEGELSNKFKFYNFIPYKFGPYSFELFHDIEQFKREEIISTDEHFIYHLSNDNYTEINLPLVISQSLDNNYEKLLKLNETELINYVYQNYPSYTIFSEIEQKQKYIRDRTGIFSIGYEGLSIDEFMLRLIEERVHTLVDVRHNPWSMKYGFKKHNLKSFCDRLGIEYLTFPHLGIPGDFRRNLKSKEDYSQLFKRYCKFIKKQDVELETIAQMAQQKRIAIMCFEKDPKFCHRTILIEELVRRGAD